MSDKRKRLSRRDAYRLALHYAIVERESFAEAWAHMDDEAAPQKAAWLASEFRRVLAESFGEQTVEDAMAQQLGPGVPLSQVVRREPSEFCAPAIDVRLRGRDEAP